MMALGGFIAVSDKRYRLKKKVGKKLATRVDVNAVAIE